MTHNQSRHRRHSIRLRNYDYSQHGAYYVTICCARKRCLFGRVVDGKTHKTPTGEMAEALWSEIPTHFADVVLDDFVVMPNHVHGIIFLSDRGGGEASVASCEGARGCAGGGEACVASCEGARGCSGGGEACLAPTKGRPVGAAPGSLGAVVGAFKSAVTKRINELTCARGPSVWQRNYYEHVIRNERDLNRIRDYIRDNPLRWHLDRENPDCAGKDEFDLWLASFRGRPHRKSL